LAARSESSAEPIDAGAALGAARSVEKMQARAAFRGSMSRRGWLLFAAMCVIWGIPYLLIKVAVDDISPAALVLARTAIAALLLLPIAAARRELRPVLRHWMPLLAFAAIEIAVPWILLGAAETRISSSLTGLLIAAVPLVGAVIARTTGDRERLGFQSGLGLLLGLAGVAAIVGVSLGGASVVPLAEIAVVAICYAVGPVILQRWLAELPALGVIAAALAVTAVAYVPIAAFSFPERMPSSAASGSVLALAVVCTAIAFLLFFALIAEVGSVRATVITYVNPAVAAVLGVAILGEHFTAGMGVGFLLVLAGSVLATRPSTAAVSSRARAGDPACEPAEAVR
jgi:drug/metabolite transporter (DMT)-like permease